MPKLPVSNKLSDYIRELILKAQQEVVRSVNTTMVLTYYEIGRMIVEDEQKGNKRAENAGNVLINLSELLTKEFGNGYSVNNLQRMRTFYVEYGKYATASCKLNFSLSWSHFV